MKICPLLWHRDTAATGREDRGSGGPTTELRGGRDGGGALAAGGAADGSPCLGTACRFGDEEGTCRLETPERHLAALLRRITENEERWENIILAVVELTERLESALHRNETWAAIAATSPSDAAAPAAEPAAAPQAAAPDRPACQAAVAESGGGDPTEESSPGQDDESASRAHARSRFHLARGRIHQHQGSLNEAAASYRHALADDPDYADAWNELGLLEWERGRLDAAVEALRRALEVDPDLMEAYLNLGCVFLAEGSPVEAAAMLREALERSPDNSVAWTHLGECLMRLERFDEARHVWEKAVALDPNNRLAAQQLREFRETTPIG